MPTPTGAKTRKHSKNRHSEHKTRNHSNLRPKHRHTKDFLKVYYPYLPLVSIVVVILALVQPWQALVTSGQVLPYATQMSVTGLVDETNERREVHKQAKLAVNSELTKAAQNKAQDMVKRDYWSHNTPEGNAPWEFINDVGYSYKKAGENLAYGFKDEDGVIAGWMNSPGHRANMLDANYQEVGFGFAESSDFVDSGPTTVVVAMYGQPSGAADVPVSTPSSIQTDSYNTLGFTAEPRDTGISKLQSFLELPVWVNYIVAGSIGAIGMYIVIKHTRRLKRAISKGERFVMHHPLLDITLVALVVLGIVISQQAGIIR